MKLGGQEKEGVSLEGDAAQRSSSNSETRPAIPERIPKRGEAGWKRGSRPARSLQDFHSPGVGLGARGSSPWTDPASAEGSSHTPGADKAVFDSGARLRGGLRWHYSFSAVPYFTGKAQQASNARVFKHSEGCDAINKLLCQRLNQPRCLPCQLYF